MEDGSGLVDLIPSLASSDMIKSSPDQLICLIKHGLAKNEETNQQMPANTSLNEVELANLVNYLRHLYVPGSTAIRTQDVKSCLANCKPG